MEGYKDRGNSLKYEDVNIKLESLNLLPLESQKERIKNYLINIEELVQKHEVERKHCIDKYKSLKFSVLKISKECTIARQTIYNNKELEMYILKSIENQEFEDIFNKQESYKDRITKLEADISKMQVRDLAIEKQSYEIDSLIENLDNNNKHIESLEIRNGELLQKVDSLEFELNKSRRNVVQFKEKD